MISQIIVYIMAGFAIIGILDQIAGNRFGLGDKFVQGVHTIGPLVVSTAGLLVLAPAIGDLCGGVVAPAFRAMGFDPAIFAGMILGTDVGGAPLAQELADTQAGAQLGGIIAASMLGATVIFTIPVGMGIIQKEDRRYMAFGILLGIITIPIGVIAGGLAAGMSLGFVLINTIPIAVLSIIIIICLWKIEDTIVKIFIIFGKCIMVVNYVGIIIGVLTDVIGIHVIDNVMSLPEIFGIIGNIGIILAGAFTMVEILSRVVKKPIVAFGRMMGINKSATEGLLLCLCNNIPVFELLKDMDKRGKVINVAFAVSGAFVFGDHLGFVASYMTEMVMPMVVGKLTAGIAAVILAYIVSSRKYKEEE